jgi:uncharacterized membrane protein
MGSRWAVALFTLGALGEYIADLLPTTPARTAAFPLAVRIVTSPLTGASVAIAGGFLLWVGLLGGAMGTIAGAFGGYRARAGWFVRFTCPMRRSRFLKTELRLAWDCC